MATIASLLHQECPDDVRKPLIEQLGKRGLEGVWLDELMDKLRSAYEPLPAFDVFMTVSAAMPITTSAAPNSQ